MGTIHTVLSNNLKMINELSMVLESISMRYII